MLTVLSAILMLSAPDVMVSTVSQDIIKEAFDTQTQHMEMVSEQSAILRDLIEEIKANTKMLESVKTAIETEGYVQIVEIPIDKYVEEQEPAGRPASPIITLLMTLGAFLVVMIVFIWIDQGYRIRMWRKRD